MTDTMREKIARGMATVDGYEFDKLAPLNCVVSPRMNGKDHWFKLADAVLALIEPVMEENERLRGTLEKIVDHESNVSDDHTECQNCRDAFFDDYFEVRALARSALSLRSENSDG